MHSDTSRNAFNALSSQLSEGGGSLLCLIPGDFVKERAIFYPELPDKCIFLYTYFVQKKCGHNTLHTLVT